jgi:hypothetical protein
MHHVEPKMRHNTTGTVAIVTHPLLLKLADHEALASGGIHP